MAVRIPIADEVRALLRIAVPVVVTQVGFVSMDLVDMLLVRGLQPSALAGMGLARGLSFAVVVIGFGILAAVDTFIAQSYGADERRKCGEHLWQGIWLSLFMAVPAALFFHDFRWALERMGQEPEVVEQAAAYLDGISISLIPVLVVTAQRSFLNGVGKTLPFMVITIAANVLNGVAAWALIYGHWGLPALGVRGAGYATLLGRAFMLASVTVLFLRPALVREYGLRPRWPDFPLLRAILRVGLPIGGQYAAEVGVFAAVTVRAGNIGATSLAAHQVALNLASFSFMVPLGISVGASVRVGHAIGRRAFEDARVAALVAYALGMGFMALVGATFAIGAWPLARLFAPDDPAVIALSATLLRIAAIFQVSDGAQVVGAGCLRGAADTRAAFLVNVVGHWGIGLPLASLLAFQAGMGARGLWFGLSASLTIVAVLLAVRFFSGRWRERAIVG